MQELKPNVNNSAFTSSGLQNTSHDSTADEVHENLHAETTRSLRSLIPADSMEYIHKMLESKRGSPMPSDENKQGIYGISNVAMTARYSLYRILSCKSPPPLCKT